MPLSFHEWNKPLFVWPPQGTTWCNLNLKRCECGSKTLECLALCPSVRKRWICDVGKNCRHSSQQSRSSPLIIVPFPYLRFLTCELGRFVWCSALGKLNVTRSLVTEEQLGVTAVVHCCPWSESSKFPLEYPRIIILVLLLKLIKLHLQSLYCNT